MGNDLIRKLSPDEVLAVKLNKPSKEWPFKNMKVDEAVEISDGFNGKSIHEIAAYARTFNQNSSKDFKVYTITKDDGASAVQVLRTK